jgi:DNA-binding CsgD family transcriptional regulator
MRAGPRPPLSQPPAKGGRRRAPDRSGTARKQDLLNTILEASLDDRAWAAVLERLCGLLGADKALVEVHRAAAPRNLFLATHGIKPRDRDLYITRYAPQNPWLRAWISHFKPGVIIPGDRLLGRLELVQTEFYQELLQRQDVFYLVGATLLHDARGLATLVLMRGRRCGPFQKAEISALKPFIPPIQQALAASLMIREAEQESRTAVEILNRIPTGILFLDSDGRVLERNRRARDLLASEDGLRLTPEGRLEGMFPGDGVRLAEAAAAVLADPEQARADSPRMVTLRRRSREAPLHLVFFADRDPGACIGEPHPRVIVFITDPWKAERPSEAILVELFGLSKAEARLAALLAQGDNLDDCAGRLGIRPATARTHLKRIFSKTGTRRQGELIRFLLESPAMLAAWEGA